MTEDEDGDIDRKVTTQGRPRRSDRVRDAIPSVRLPSTLTVAVASLYALFAVGILSVAFGVTSLAAAYGGVYAAYVSAGFFATTYAYIGLQVVARV
jgi:hypothetical protein